MHLYFNKVLYKVLFKHTQGKKKPVTETGRWKRTNFFVIYSRVNILITNQSWALITLILARCNKMTYSYCAPNLLQARSPAQRMRLRSRMMAWAGTQNLTSQQLANTFLRPWNTDDSSLRLWKRKATPYTDGGHVYLWEKSPIGTLQDPCRKLHHQSTGVLKGDAWGFFSLWNECSKFM